MIEMFVIEERLEYSSGRFSAIIGLHYITYSTVLFVRSLSLLRSQQMLKQGSKR